MKKILYTIFIFLIVANCSFKKVVKHHGVPNLDKKQKNLTINLSNKNDIIKILGQPSSKSKFDNDTWIYIERKQTQSKIKNLGKMKIYKNNVLVLDLDKYGILKNKEFYDMNDMNKLTIVKSKTEAGYNRNSFIYKFMSSMRQKINDPLGQRAKKREKVRKR